ncbi:glutaredoxin domain-containing cysteine-rich protein 2-like [Acipenser ruthenus]|uniref:glutaredoxin domain-containing cysteine-rich protein 2-like n=1 Tax=Acipenser ruthenus TaxID=7906 RepID=UPI001561A3BC|nr:glutaredoxin domain-containing cysteine-rich protein 2-like [Acipenser ruthenus]
MEELQRKLSQRYEDKPKKVRFKISSSYSGRVLKQVYEDGQELESPEVAYPHSFIHGKFPKHMEGELMCNFAELQDQGFYSPTTLTAQRINVFRDGNKYHLAGGSSLFNDFTPADSKPSPVLDFGKIIIYTSNLRIIRTSQGKKELANRFIHNRDGSDGYSITPAGENGAQNPTQREPAEDQNAKPANALEGVSESGCLQCGGSGCAPCSLCHGSKLSMLANRFKESIRALRCPACNANGLQPCQACTHSNSNSI